MPVKFLNDTAYCFMHQLCQEKECRYRLHKDSEIKAMKEKIPIRYFMKCDQFKEKGN